MCVLFVPVHHASPGGRIQGETTTALPGIHAAFNVAYRTTCNVALLLFQLGLIWWLTVTWCEHILLSIGTVKPQFQEPLEKKYIYKYLTLNLVVKHRNIATVATNRAINFCSIGCNNRYIYINNNN